MRLSEVMQQNGKWVKMRLYVKSVGMPCETMTEGFCQAIEVADEGQTVDILNYFYPYEGADIKADEVGERWYEVRFVKNKNYLQCKPCEPEPVVWDSGKPDWYKINLGKCRHGILCAMLQAGMVPEVSKDMACLINNLAEFSMTGEIHEARQETVS